MPFVIVRERLTTALTSVASTRRRLNIKFSRRVLDDFRTSGLYEMIDKVANTDESIIRKRDFNSAAAISDDESSPPPATSEKKKIKLKQDPSDTDTSELLRVVLLDTNTRSERKVKLEEEALALAKKKDEREEIELERRHKRDEAELKERMMRTQNDLMKQLMSMVEHPNEAVRKLAQKQLEKLLEEMN